MRVARILTALIASLAVVAGVPAFLAFESHMVSVTARVVQPTPTSTPLAAEATPTPTADPTVEPSATPTPLAAQETPTPYPPGYASPTPSPYPFAVPTPFSYPFAIPTWTPVAGHATPTSTAEPVVQPSEATATETPVPGWTTEPAATPAPVAAEETPTSTAEPIVEPSATPTGAADVDTPSPTPTATATSEEG
jgi:hypothetical protein